MNRVSERKTGPHPRAAMRTPRMHPGDRALDVDRTASMADEGGRAGAKMDLREQFADTQDLLPCVSARAPMTQLFWLGAAGAAAGLATGLWLGRRRASTT
jgi:hypothetical protein